MGRYSGYGEKTETDGLLWIDTVSLKRMGYLTPGTRSGQLSWTGGSGNKSNVWVTVSLYPPEGSMKLNYKTTDHYSGEEKHYDYPVRIFGSPCNFGGYRYWFICPLVKNGQKCQRTVRKLYCSQGYFGCRDCLNLTYSSQNENPAYRYGFFRVATDQMRAEELLATIKVPFYKGQPTRKMRRFLRLRPSSEAVDMAVEEARKSLGMDIL